MVILKFISIFFLTSIIYSIPDANVKALWIVRDHMTNPDLIDEALGFAENNGFNHIFAQVRGRGDSFYNSKFVPKSILVDPNFDPLNYLINKCKRKNIKVMTSPLHGEDPVFKSPRAHYRIFFNSTKLKKIHVRTFHE